jgi:hypothetical protein
MAFVLRLLDPIQAAKQPPWPLSRTKRNAVFGRIQNLELDPAQFEWLTVLGTHSWAVAAIRHRPSQHFFVFDGGHEHGDHEPPVFLGISSPGRRGLIDKVECANWESLLQLVNGWLLLVKCEAEAPDLWQAVASETAIFGAAAEPDNSPFTPEQQRLIAARIDEIEQYLVNVAPLNEAEAARAHRRFDYLKEAATRVGRQDWLNITISALFGVALEAALPPEQVREFFRFTWTALTNVVGIAVEKLIALTAQ